MSSLKCGMRGPLLLFLLTAGAYSATIAAAQADNQPEAGGPIHLNVVVDPQSGKGAPIPDLPQSAFTVLDNGQPQAITSFRAVQGEQAPVKVILVVDDVNISYTRLSYARSQIEKFLHANEGRLPNPTELGLVTDTDVELTPQFSTDGNALAGVLDNKQIGLRDLRRDSGFYGAQERLDISLRALNQVIAKAASIPGRKAIVWVSPGWPLLSGPGVQLSGKQQESIYHEVIGFTQALRRADVTLYSVDPLGAGQGPLSTFYYEQFLKQPRKPSQVQLGNLGLQVLAIQSGGKALSSSNDVTELLERCVADFKAFYEITYTPPPSDAPEEFHQIDVRVNQPHAVAQTRQGYYAQP